MPGRVDNAARALGRSEGIVTGAISPAQVLAKCAGIRSGDFDELVRAIRNGAAYANVHSTLFPAW